MTTYVPTYSGSSGGSGSYSGTTTRRTTTRSTSSGSGSSGSGISSAESRMIARENAAKRKAATRYRTQAAALNLQANALRRSLSSKGFLHALHVRLANSELVYKQQDASLVEGYGIRSKSLHGASGDNEKSRGDQSFANLNNRSRERTAAINEASANGAGESDLLRTQMMSLRSWDSNQGEVNRSFFDSLRSINSSLDDLNVDTKTARLNAENQKNNDVDQLYTQYFNQKSEAYTQLGNIRGQQAELYGYAQEQRSGSSGLQRRATRRSGSAFNSASKYATAVHKNPGHSKALMNWKGDPNIEGRTNDSRIENAPVNIAAAVKPEGATLRSW